MDFGRTLSRAWEIAWRWKVLWILGFLAALGQGTGAANSGYRFSGQEFQNGMLPAFRLPAGAEALIIGLACLGIIIAIALWVVSVIARGGLIAGVGQVEEEGSTSLGRAWVAGQSRFWTLFGIGILVALPVIVLVVGHGGRRVPGGRRGRVRRRQGQQCCRSHYRQPFGLSLPLRLPIRDRSRGAEPDPDLR